MNSDALFCTLEPADIAGLIRGAQRLVCYAAPGVQPDVAKAMVDTGARLGPELLTVCLDFDERVMRMGLPPSSDELGRIGDALGIDQQASLGEHTIDFDATVWRQAAFDGGFAFNGEEREFAKSLDDADFVRWWHRNPDKTLFRAGGARRPSELLLSRFRCLHRARHWRITDSATH
jgi:hypothetical protein